MIYPFRLHALVPGIDRFKLPSAEYVKFVLETAQKAERFGYTGALIHYNHDTLSPWSLATTVIEHTSSLIPLIALQPSTMSPLTAIKMVESIAFLYERQVFLNMIAGASKTELEEIGDTVAHDQRYERLIEYVEVIRTLCGKNGLVTYEGKYYRLKKFKAHSLMSLDMMPQIFIAGSSAAGIQAALKVADVAVTHPQPIDLFRENLLAQPEKVGLGIRIGIIARAKRVDAWEVARARFPLSRLGNIRITMQKNSESKWIQDLAHLATEADIYDDVFWLGAYRSSSANCPYLVGDYDQIASYLNQYLASGAQDILVDGPITDDDFYHTDRVFQHMLNRGCSLT